MQQCGLCSALAEVFRRLLCIGGSRRGSGQSYYQELEDDETRRNGISIDRSEHGLFIRMVDPCGSLPSRSKRLSQSDWLLLETLDTRHKRPHPTGRFLTMHKRRRKRLITRSLTQDHALLDDIHHGQVQCVLDKVNQWPFNAFILDNVTGGRSLPVLCVHLFHWYGLLDYFRLDVVRCWKFFTLIEEGYHSTNPYHNSIHATDVTQAMHCFLQEKKIREHLTPLEVMASLIAAVTHDLDHPGVNQPFLIATSNHLAALYENSSVLENHHWRSAIGCLLESHVAEELEDCRPELQRQISSLILATDITRQQEFLVRFKRYLDQDLLDMQLEEHRHFILQIALKCADISNPCRPWDVSKKWSQKVCEEFFRQGDYERQLNLPVTALCDRQTTSVPKIQAGFFTFVVYPLFEEWHRFLGDGLSDDMMKNLRGNKLKWDALILQESADENKTENVDETPVEEEMKECSRQDISSCLESGGNSKTSKRTNFLAVQNSNSLQKVGRRHSVPLSVPEPLAIPRTITRRESLAIGEKKSCTCFQSTLLVEEDEEVEDEKEPTSLGRSSLSLLSNNSGGGESEEVDGLEKRPLSSENLLPELSITSITTVTEASRLSNVLNKGKNPQKTPGKSQLTRQQTFPPVQACFRQRYFSTTAEMSRCTNAEMESLKASASGEDCEEPEKTAFETHCGTKHGCRAPSAPKMTVLKESNRSSFKHGESDKQTCSKREMDSSSREKGVKVAKLLDDCLRGSFEKENVDPRGFGTDFEDDGALLSRNGSMRKNSTQGHLSKRRGSAPVGSEITNPVALALRGCTDRYPRRGSVPVDAIRCNVLEKENSEQKKERFLEKTGNKIKKMLSQTFTVWATYCARNPSLVFAVSSWVIALLGYGMYNLKITTDPTEIWASPSCKSRLDKTYFDSRFTPFYRTNQVFIKSKGLKSFNWTSSDNFTYIFGPAYNSDFLYEVYKLQMQIQQLGVKEGKGLEKICFSPMKNEFFNDNSTKYCAIQSVWGYLNNDASILNNTYQLYNTLQICVRNNFDPTCLAPYGGPIFSALAVGGQQETETDDPFKNKYLLATGVTLTFLVNNALNAEQLEPALEWEKMFIDFLKNWKENNKPEFMEIAFSAERSIQDEIERESKAEMTTIIISYFVMFIYITVSLGRIRGFSSLLLDSKATLGIGGIVIVLASVIASLGVFGYLGISTTLLTIEVIPFLVLAVGVDNIFILVHTYQQLRETKGGETEELIGLALGNVGPSILLTSTSEAACFFIGTLSDMPAIKTFAEYSSLAIIFNFLLQISCFVSLMAVDSRRQKNNYADIFCCVKVKQAESQKNASNILYLLFKNYYGPFLMKTGVRIVVIVVFLFWFCFSICCIFRIEKGLDQELSMPEDSYVIDYFQFMKDLFSMGPPVYFVLKNGLNYTNPIEVNAVCGTVGCDSDSLVTYLTRASRLSNISYIAKSPSSWIDDYFDWLSSPQCCKLFAENNTFCPHQISECESCDVRVENWRPWENDFKKYLPFFLNDNPDIECPKAGHAAYAGGVNFEMNQLGQLQVTDNYFMAYHTSLTTSKDFYMALKNAREIADHLSAVLTKKLNRTIEVFPYSIFYVYYEQYLTIVEDAALSLSLSLLAVFGVTFLFTGFDLRSACLVGLVVTSMLVNMTAMLHWWSITLNAVSLVNLLVAVGIGVEFCSHIVHAFVSSSEPDKMSRALDSISTMGSSVFSGITLTKFLGIIVLAFAQTLMLRIFYFRMYLGIVVMGAAHGLVLMPVLLSYFG